MKYCSLCKVKVSTKRDVCPLCGATLDTIDDSYESVFPDKVKQIKERKSYNLLIKIFLFISFLAASSCIIINLLTFNYSKSLWSLIVFASIVYFWLLIRGVIFSRQKITKRIVWQFVLISLLLVLIDFLTGYTKWALTYAVPFLCIATTLSISIFIWVRIVKLREYITYTILMLILSLIPLILAIFKTTTTLWPTVISVAYAVITFMGFLIFAEKSMGLELKKKFHIK